MTPSMLVVGSGPEEDALKAHAASLGVKPQMTFEPPGPIRRPCPARASWSFPSRAESLPYVILEAAAAAQPLVSTDVGGIPEIYGPRHAGRLIRANDARGAGRGHPPGTSAAPVKLKSEAVDLAAHLREHFRLEAMIDGVIAGYRDAPHRAQGG